MEKTGQFRFTPPTHNIVAFNKALDDHFTNGGVSFTKNKYILLNKILIDGMENIGFKCQIDEKLRGYFITSFYYYANKCFNFEHLYEFLNNNGFVIYPGDTTKKTFRIGNIGNLSVNNMNVLVEKISKYIDILESHGFTSNSISV